MIATLRSLHALAFLGRDPREFPRTAHYRTRCHERGFDDALLPAVLGAARVSRAEHKRGPRLVCEAHLRRQGHWRVILAEDTCTLITVVRLP